MRVMAVDYGDARTGLAVSDASATLAGEAWVIKGKSLPEAAHIIAGEAEGRGISAIIVGYPKNMNGTVGPRAKKSEQLAEHIRELCDIEVVLWDERMTTMSAHRILTNTGRHGKKRKQTIDAVAASLILENYLDYLKRAGS
jgi:putative Holliday junction resolvase